MQLNNLKISAIILATAIVTSSTMFFLFKQMMPVAQAVKIETPIATKVNQPNHALVNTKPSYPIPGDFVATANTVVDGVVNITTFSGFYRSSSGSGVIISDDGYIITNHHVVEGGSSFEVSLSNKRDLKAEVIGTDPTTDLALLKIDATDLKPIKFGNSDNTKVGEWVLAVGNPFDLASTVTAGIVSAKGRDINILGDNEFSIESFIQTDAVVNPGNSGGALVNATGELVGINTAIITETGGYEGYSFAIPSNLVMKVITDLKNHGEVKRAVLGVTINDVNDRLAKNLNLDAVEGVVINKVIGGGSADLAGLQSNDVIIEVNNKKVGSVAALQEKVAQYRPGDSISVAYIRDGELYVIDDVELKGLAETAFETRR